MSSDEFDVSDALRRDDALGHLLRDHLDGPGGLDGAAFGARVRAAVLAADDGWSILGRWAWPGLAAAAVLLLALGGWLATAEPRGEVTLAEAMRPDELPAALVDAPRAPEPQAVYEAVLAP